jgi:hypothetical protein
MLKRTYLSLILLGLLAACGGGGGDSGSSSTGTGIPGTPESGGAVTGRFATMYDATTIAPDGTQRAGWLVLRKDGTYFGVQTVLNGGSARNVVSGTYTDDGFKVASKTFVRADQNGLTQNGSWDGVVRGFVELNGLSIAGGQTELFGILAVNSGMPGQAAYSVGALAGNWMSEPVFGEALTNDVSFTATASATGETISGRLANGCAFTGATTPLKEGGASDVLATFDAASCTGTADPKGKWKGVGRFWVDANGAGHGQIGMQPAAGQSGAPIVWAVATTPGARGVGSDVQSAIATFVGQRTYQVCYQAQIGGSAVDQGTALVDVASDGNFSVQFSNGLLGFHGVFIGAHAATGTTLDFNLDVLDAPGFLVGTQTGARLFPTYTPTSAIGGSYVLKPVGLGC